METFSDVQLVDAGIHSGGVLLIIFLVRQIKNVVPPGWNRWLPLFVVLLSFCYAFSYSYAEKHQQWINPVTLGTQIATMAIAVYSGVKTVAGKRNDQTSLTPGDAGPPGGPTA